MNKNNKFKFSKSEKSVFQALERGNPEPSQEFVASLEKKLLNGSANNESKPSFLFNLRGFFKMTKKQLAIGGGVASLLLIAAVGVSYWGYNTYFKPETPDLAYILEQARAKNANPAANRSKLASAESYGAGDMAQTSMIGLPYFEPKTYTETTYTIKNGPAAAQCLAMTEYIVGSGTINENYFYYAEDGSYYSKNIVRDIKNKNIIRSYNLANDTGSYTYMGGEYAVYEEYYDSMYITGKADPSMMELLVEETISSDSGTASSEEGSDLLPIEIAPVDPDMPVEEPTEEPIVTDPLFFGDDSELLGTETIDGVDYHIISWTYGIGCNSTKDAVGTTVNLEVTDKAVIKSWVNSETFEMLKDETYLNSINEKNLLLSTSYSHKEEIREESEITSKFAFDLKVAVKEMPYVEYDYVTESMKYIDNAKANGVQLLSPAGMELSYVSGYAEADPSVDYWSDRKFYAPGAIGDADFKLYSPTERSEGGSSILNASYQAAESYLYIDSFKNIDFETYLGMDLDKLGDPNMSVKKSNTNIVIDGATVSAEVIELTSIGYTSMPESGEEGSSDSGSSVDLPTSFVEEAYTTYYIMFKHAGLTYIVTSGTKDFDASSLNFKAYDLTVQSSYDAVKEMIIEANEKLEVSNEMVPRDQVVVF